MAGALPKEIHLLEEIIDALENGQIDAGASLLRGYKEIMIENND